MGVLSFVLLLSITSVASLGSDFKLHAEHVEKDEQKKTLILRGHASVIQADHKLTADKIVINSEVGTITATGSCKYEDGKISLKDSDMIFKVEDHQWTLIKRKL